MNGLTKLGINILVVYLGILLAIPLGFFALVLVVAFFKSF